VSNKARGTKPAAGGANYLRTAGITIGILGSVCLILVFESMFRFYGTNHKNVLSEILVQEGSLVDPVSAQFKDVKVDRDSFLWFMKDRLILGEREWSYRGMINAKNRMGGYVGWKPFMASKNTSAYGKEKHYSFSADDYIASLPMYRPMVDVDIR